MQAPTTYIAEAVNSIMPWNVITSYIAEAGRRFVFKLPVHALVHTTEYFGSETISTVAHRALIWAGFSPSNECPFEIRPLLKQIN